MSLLILLFLLLILFEIIIGFNLVFPILVYLIWKLKGKKTVKDEIDITEKDFAIIITAYQETSQIPIVVASALDLNYQNYHIYVVADNCQPNSDLTFDNEKVTVLFPEKVIASNTGSHFFAINNFIRNHDVLMITDSDNILHKNILQELNKDFLKGYEASQGLRSAKNLDTTFACLDAARDIYYHFYDGKLLSEIGSSATLAGSGMAFNVKLYKQSLENLNVKGAGFDKVLQYEILKQNKRIVFNEDAIIYDEKTSKPDQLVNQRARWINTWFKYFKFGFSLIGKSFINRSFNQFIFGIVLLRPPLFIFLLISVLFIFINLFLNPWISLVWIIGILLFILSFILALKNSNTDKRIYKALSSIPVFIYYQIVSLILSRKANQRSVATKHNYNN